MPTKFFILMLLLLTTACASLQPAQKTEDSFSVSVSVQTQGNLLSRFAPQFILEEAEKSYNRIGSPGFKTGDNGQPVANVDPNHPTIFAQQQVFSSNGRTYRNLIYRVHFESTPNGHLTAGNNVGLLALVTLDSNNIPLLLTTVHTCGCYLAIIPTSALPESAYPADWPAAKQDIYGELLPARIDIDREAAQHRFAIRVRGATHRVMDIGLLKPTTENAQTAELLPMQSLRELPFKNKTLSFFETEGPRKGYVRGSYKPYERWLMGWWALDLRVGEDKDLGPSNETGTVFYTSLKPWAREKSDLWEFSRFLKYWGWNL
ncbi:hypothetical protein [Malonomonas rubra]|nr:hypothetical protein [Malonomonas rubra]